MSARRLVALGACAAAVITACIDSVEPLPLGIDVQATPASVSVGDTITFQVAAQGQEITSVTITYDDGAGDQFAPFGARTARVTFRHPYAAIGDYRVHATVGDAAGHLRTDSVDVAVK